VQADGSEAPEGEEERGARWDGEARRTRRRREAGVLRRGHVRGRGGRHRHSAQDRRRAPSGCGQAGGRDVHGADPMDLDARASARRAELHRQTVRAKCVRSSHSSGRQVRAAGNEAYVEASAGDSMQRTSTRTQARRPKRERKRRLQERDERHALGVGCDASAASTMMGEVGEAEVDSLRRGRAKVGACGMPARRTLCRCVRGARCPRYTRASPRVRVLLQEVTVSSSRMATPVLVWVGKSVLAVSSCARAPLHLQLTGAGAGGARGRGCAMARAMALRGRESRTR
jgi:hypothetical protein